ncbi:MAG: hypothetical protein K6V97_03930 [Actinomycetia bacterium]|nr:hypothetical protein [Actinomycetes bacterium]
MAGHGIPPHVIERLTGATHAHHVAHQVTEGPDEDIAAWVRTHVKHLTGHVRVEHAPGHGLRLHLHPGNWAERGSALADAVRRLPLPAAVRQRVEALEKQARAAADWEEKDRLRDEAERLRTAFYDRVERFLADHPHWLVPTGSGEYSTTLGAWGDHANVSIRTHRVPVRVSPDHPRAHETLHPEVAQRRIAHYFGRQRARQAQAERDAQIRTKRAVVTIAVHTPAGRTETETRQGWVFPAVPGVGVHKDAHGYTITHLASGAALLTAPSLTEAKQMVARLGRAARYYRVSPTAPKAQLLAQRATWKKVLAYARAVDSRGDRNAEAGPVSFRRKTLQKARGGVTSMLGEGAPPRTSVLRAALATAAPFRAVLRKSQRNTHHLDQWDYWDYDDPGEAADRLADELAVIDQEAEVARPHRPGYHAKGFRRSTTDAEQMRAAEDALRKLEAIRRVLAEDVAHERAELRIRKSETPHRLTPAEQRRYLNPDGTFKGGFDGAVRYFEAQGYDHDTAVKIAGKIAVRKRLHKAARLTRDPKATR